MYRLPDQLQSKVDAMYAKVCVTNMKGLVRHVFLLNVWFRSVVHAATTLLPLTHTARAYRVHDPIPPRMNT